MHKIIHLNKISSAKGIYTSYIDNSTTELMWQIKVIIARIFVEKSTKTAGSAMEACHQIHNRMALLPTGQPTDKETQI